jgi:SCP-2 sterol transfer family
MRIGSAREFFATLASRGHDPRLADLQGSWQFDIDGLGSWQVKVDHGAFVVDPNPKDTPTARLVLSEPELVRLVNGDGHENVLSSALRGALRVGGELRFAYRLRDIVPVPQEWRAGA